MLMLRINRIRGAGAIKRFHTARVIKEESVAEHSLNVVALILVLTKGQASRNLLIAAALHDHGEAAIGDIPANIKTRMPPDVRADLETKEYEEVSLMFPELEVGCHLSPEEAYTLHIADKIDGLLKCSDEVKMGNRHLEAIGERYVSYLYELTDKNDLYRIDVQIIVDNFRRICNGR
jgi:5'-deoxynucleotidase YfbR-like HD superfamily hydrolase